MIAPLLLAAILAGPGFRDATAEVGLGPDVIDAVVARVAFADLDADGRPDAVIDRHRVFLNVADDESPVGRRFVEVSPATTGLATPQRSTLVVFADLDADGHLDAISTEYVDAVNPDWEDHGRRTRWQPGHGDGTFGEARPIGIARPATTSAIAVGDIDRDGLCDLWLGHWYVHYGASLAAHRNEVLLQRRDAAGAMTWERLPLPSPGDEDDAPGAGFDEQHDAAGRPTYGTLIVDLDVDGQPELLELNYGRRWNRCFRATPGTLAFRDVAPAAALDGDDVRHGRYPDWLKERAKTDSRFDRPDEQPFRANGNTFDAAAGDLDGDLDFDLLISEITHGWAGESSDRSRVLLNDAMRFAVDPRVALDRPHANARSWNQGDLFCAFADLDHDGHLDVILSSGDYPDDQRLRVFLRGADGTARDATAALGIDHDGAQQISLADVDDDGDLDILVGQTFNRFTKEQRADRSPRPKLLINEATEGRRSITLRLAGKGAGMARDALGAVVIATLEDDRRLVRQLVGVGGHAGKQHDFVVHLGLGDHDGVRTLQVRWPDRETTTQTFHDVAAGRYALEAGGELRSLGR